MMKKYILLTLIFPYCLTGGSQTYEHYYRTQYDDIVYDALKINNEEVVFALNYGEYPNNYSSLIIKMDMNIGNFVDSVILLNDTGFIYQGVSKIFLTDTNLLTIVGTCKNIVTNDKQIFIANYTDNFDLIMDTIVGDPNLDEIFFDVIFSSDSLLVFSGMREYGTVLLEERTINGILVKSKNYTGLGTLSSTIVEIPQNNNYHLYGYWDNNHSFYVINKNDLSVKTSIEYNGWFLPRNAYRKQNANYYYVFGRKLSIEPVEQDNLFYLKLSNSGEILQEIEISNDSITYYTQNCFGLNENSIYFGGAYPCTWTAPLEFYPEQRWVFLNKLDLDGNIIWQKYYKGNVNFMPYKVLATNDGGAIIFSSFYDWNDPIPNQRDVHILKIDSLGYYTPLTGTPEKFEQMEKQILVYPNPVTSKVNFVFGLYNNLKIDIFDMKGEKVFSKTFVHSAKIDIAHFKPGIYPYVISGENGFHEEGKMIKK
ncbi:MAG: T9SS type A sorting domain-containing protein [Chlorobi bacterium]|nr:T9SS type A sorting domain-containing protein [Chlorobiota bacterium]